MTFRIGMKVVCVIQYRGDHRFIAPKEGAIYTIRDLLDIGEEPSLRVCEIVNTPLHYSNISGALEPAFVRRAFRPLVEPKADISIFTKMLTGSKIGADA